MNEFDAYRAGPSRETLEGLLRSQAQTVYNLCFQVLREGSQAEDAAQQVLLDLVKQIPRLSDASHLKAWVSRAAFHAALDLKKKERRRTAHERRTAEMQKTPALAPDQIDAVHTEIARLEDDLRTVVVEHYFEKRPLKDLAAEQAVSEVAVWKRLQKAKDRLRQSLTATGFSAALLGLDSLLEALEPVRAPKGLVGPGLMVQAAVLLTGAPAPLLLAGGIAVKTKLIASVGLIVLALAAAVGIAVNRSDRTEADEALGASTRTTPRKANAAATTAPAAADATTAPPAATAAPEGRPRFTSFLAYYEAMMKASYTVDAAERARAFRKIGLPVSDEEMGKLSADCPFRAGTEEFSKHILLQLDKIAKRIDPKAMLDQARAFTDIEEKRRIKMLRRGLEDWTLKDPAAAHAYAATLTEQEGRTEILARLSSSRPTPANLSQVLALPQGQERTSALHAAVMALTRADPAAALRAVEELARGSDRTDALRSLVGQWASMDFAAALAYAERTTDPRERELQLSQVIASGAEKDPQAAARAALKHVDPKGGSMTTFYSLIQAMAKTDPAASAKVLDQVPQLLGRNIIVVQELAPRWGAKDPVEALVWVQQLPAEDQPAAINAVLKGWVKSPKGNLAEAREMTRHLPEAFRAKALETVVVAWAEIEPSAAAAFALAGVPDAMTEVIQRWIQRDDDAATAWIRALSNPEARDKALLGMSHVYQMTDIARAVRTVEEMRSGPLRDQALGKLSSSASKMNFDQGMEILRKIQDPVVRDSSLGLTIALISRNQPRQAMAAIDLMADPAKRDQAIDSFLAWGSEADPQAAREVLAKMAKVEALQYQRVADGFAKKDPLAAATWALTLPDKQMDPQIGDRSKEMETRPRDWALNSVMNAWGATDPDAAARWIKQSALPEETKSSLLSIVKFQRSSR